MDKNVKYLSNTVKNHIKKVKKLLGFCLYKMQRGGNFECQEMNL